MEVDVVQVGRQVRARRLALGLTQEQLGERLGLGARSISHIETGRRVGYTREDLERLAHALETSVAQLLRVPDEKVGAAMDLEEDEYLNMPLDDFVAWVAGRHADWAEFSAWLEERGERAVSD